MIGVEMAGALKNVYAIAVGMGYSLGIGENTRAAVMARAVREMAKLGEPWAGSATPSPAGRHGRSHRDLHQPRSRNRHVGEQLGAASRSTRSSDR
ncbi:NAD-dependent glycerol-3-phosphate dehydrogenase family protein [Mycobacterium xenopi 3993]|nr:NAD-dependent glycerol-3-phosphate dehydrogenase family protein [Mycobacterium xenopi 3993]